MSVFDKTKTKYANMQYKLNLIECCYKMSSLGPSHFQVKSMHYSNKMKSITFSNNLSSSFTTFKPFSLLMWDGYLKGKDNSMN